MLLLAVACASSWAIVHFLVTFIRRNWIDSSSTSREHTNNKLCNRTQSYLQQQYSFNSILQIKILFFSISLSPVFALLISSRSCFLFSIVPLTCAWDHVYELSNVKTVQGPFFYELFWLLSFPTFLCEAIFFLLSDCDVYGEHIYSYICVTNQLENELVNNNSRFENWKWSSWMAHETLYNQPN